MTGLIIFISLFTFRNVTELFLKPKQKTKIIDGRISLALYTLLYFLVGGSIIIFLWIDRTTNIELLCIGLFLFMVAFGLRIWFTNNMKRSFSLSISPNADGSLITKGPNKLIRHPIYSAFILEFIGLITVRPNFVAISLFIVLLIVVFYRIKEEEKSLTTYYGEEYLTYKIKGIRYLEFFL